MNKISYALGMSAGANLSQSGAKDINYQDFLDGVKVMMEQQEPKMGIQEANQLIHTYFMNLERAEADKNKQEGAEFLKSNGQKEGVVTTASGLQYKVLTAGEGTSPNQHSTVVCHYEGKFINGEVFDSSYQRSQPASFGLDQVIPGWTEGLQLMKTGEKYEFYIPYDLAYGEKGYPGAIPPYATLIFTVELLEVK